MENSQSLATVAATESFSYGWFANQEIFHENNNNSTHTEEDNFNFDIRPFDNAIIVHADEIFSHGHILPLYAQRPQIHDDDGNAFGIPSRSSCIAGTRFFNQKETGSDLSPTSLSKKPAEVYVEKWKKSSKRILQRCLGFVKKMVGSRKSIRVDDFERKVCEIRSCGNSSPRANDKELGKKIDIDLGIKRLNSSLQQASPLPRSSSSCYDVKRSIHEAVLYCKGSIEK